MNFTIKKILPMVLAIILAIALIIFFYGNELTEINSHKSIIEEQTKKIKRHEGCLALVMLGFPEDANELWQGKNFGKCWFEVERLANTLINRPEWYILSLPNVRKKAHEQGQGKEFDRCWKLLCEKSKLTEELNMDEQLRVCCEVLLKHFRTLPANLGRLEKCVNMNTKSL